MKSFEIFNIAGIFTGTFACSTLVDASKPQFEDLTNFMGNTSVALHWIIVLIYVEG